MVVFLQWCEAPRLIFGAVLLDIGCLVSYEIGWSRVEGIFYLSRSLLLTPFDPLIVLRSFIFNLDSENSPRELLKEQANFGTSLQVSSAFR